MIDVKILWDCCWFSSLQLTDRQIDDLIDFYYSGGICKCGKGFSESKGISRTFSH